MATLQRLVNQEVIKCNVNCKCYYNNLIFNEIQMYTDPSQFFTYGPPSLCAIVSQFSLI